MGPGDPLRSTVVPSTTVAILPIGSPTTESGPAVGSGHGHEKGSIGMPVEIIGMVGTRDASEIKGPLVDGPVVDWMDGPVIDPDYLVDISRAHEQAGFDRVLVGYGAVAPEGWAVAASVLHHTERLKVLVAHRPGFVQPALLARKAATLDHLTGGGRIAIHFITGGDEADQRREGDFVPHDARYRRTGEVMSIVRRMWEEGAPFDFEGEFFRYEGAFTSVKPVSPGRDPALLRRGLARRHRGRRGPRRRLRLLGRAPGRRGGADELHRAGGGESRTYPPLQHLAASHHRRHRGRGLGEGRVDRRDRRPSGSSWPRSGWPAGRRRYQGLGGAANATLSVDRDTGGTTSVGRKRLIAMSAEREVYDERLWMKVANLTGAAGNSTALVGTPEQVAEAMLRYYDLGITTLLLKGFDPVPDAVEFGKELLPMVREGVEDRSSSRPLTA